MYISPYIFSLILKKNKRKKGRKKQIKYTFRIKMQKHKWRNFFVEKQKSDGELFLLTFSHNGSYVIRNKISLDYVLQLSELDKNTARAAMRIDMETRWNAVASAMVEERAKGKNWMSRWARDIVSPRKSFCCSCRETRTKLTS